MHAWRRVAILSASEPTSNRPSIGVSTPFPDVFRQRPQGSALRVWSLNSRSLENDRPVAHFSPERRQRLTRAAYRPLARVLGGERGHPLLSGRPCAVASLRGPRGLRPRVLRRREPGTLWRAPIGPAPVARVDVFPQDARHANVPVQARARLLLLVPGRPRIGSLPVPARQDEQNLRSGQEFAGSSQLQERQRRTVGSVRVHASSSFVYVYDRVQSLRTRHS